MTRKNREEQDAINREHAANPVPGDYWTEFFMGVCLVLAVSRTHVISTWTTMPVDDGNRWSFDVGNAKIQTRDEFAAALKYDVKDETSPVFGKCHCDCQLKNINSESSQAYAAKWFRDNFAIAEKPAEEVIFPAIYQACLHAAKSLGSDIKKLSWFGRNWKR